MKSFKRKTSENETESVKILLTEVNKLQWFQVARSANQENQKALKSNKSLAPQIYSRKTSNVLVPSDFGIPSRNKCNPTGHFAEVRPELLIQRSASGSSDQPTCLDQLQPFQDESEE